MLNIVRDLQLVGDLQAVVEDLQLKPLRVAIVDLPLKVRSLQPELNRCGGSSVVTLACSSSRK